jgi:hypothetical protein
MSYYRKKRLTNAARNMMFRDYLDRRESREEARREEKSEYEKKNTYLFFPLEDKKTYFSFILMKNGNAKITDIHGDVSNVDVPDFIISSDTVSKKFDEQEDFSSKFPIKITVLGRIEVMNLKTIILPNTIGKIFDDTFSGNESLEYVQFPKYLKEIGNNAFYGCKSITKISIPYSVTKIGNETFAQCTGLKSIKFSKKTESYGSYFLWNTGIEILGIPNNITKVDSAFNGMGKLKRLYLHEHVTEITASFNSVNLSKIVVDEHNEFFDSRQECNAIIDSKSNELLSGCKNTILPSDVKITNLNKFSSYGKYLVISEDDLFDVEKSPMKKFVEQDIFPELYFTFDKPEKNDRINWFEVNVDNFIEEWFKQNHEQFGTNRNFTSDKCLYEIYLYKPLLEEISKIDHAYLFKDSTIYFEYPFAFYHNEWQLDSKTRMPILKDDTFDTKLPRKGKQYSTRDDLISKCEDIIGRHLTRFYSNKSNYKKDYISKYGLTKYRIESVSDDFKNLVKEKPLNNHFAYYVDNTWVSWTEIRGSEYNELCDWDEINLEWIYKREDIW